MEPADRFAANPWERRVAELERAMGEKSRRILQLEQEVARRDARLSEALTRLSEAEEAVDAQAQLVMLSGEAGVSAAPDALARVAAEKGVLESRERQLRGERDRLLAERNQREAVVQNLRTTVEQAKLALNARDRRLLELESRLRAADTGHGKASAEWRAERERMALDMAKTIELGKEAALARAKVERSLADAEHQVELYRKNLVQAESDMNRRDEELVVACEEQVRLQNELRRQERQVAFVERQRDRLQERLEEETAWAEERHLQLQRLYDRCRLSNVAAVRESRGASERARQSEAEVRALVAQRDALRSTALRVQESMDEQRREIALNRELVACLESQILATRLIANRGPIVALERALAAFADHGVQPPSAIAVQGPLIAPAPGKVSALMRWLRRS